MSKIKNNKEQSISMNIHKYLLVSTIIFLGIFALTQSSEAVCSWSGNTGTVVSPYSASDVSACITDSSSKTGAVIIQIPNATVTWSGGISVNMSSGFANVTSLTITGLNACTVDAKDRPTACGTNITNFRLTYFGVDNKALRVSNMRLTGASGVNIDGYGKSWRFDHLLFDASTGVTSSRIFWIGGSVGTYVTYGVIDSCTVNNSNAIFIHYQPSGDGGNYSWMRPLDLGGPDAFYLENNTFYFTAWNASAMITDANGAARYVFRYNDVTNGYIGAHDAIVGGYRGVRKWEVYNNTFTDDANGGCHVFAGRGGTGVIFNNTITDPYNTNCNDGVQLSVYRSYRTDGDPWGNLCSASSGKAILDTSSNYPQTCSSGTDCINIDGSSSNPSGYPCRDQAGVDGNNPQISKPYLLWNNRRNGHDIAVSLNQTGPYIVQNRDFCTSSTTMPASCNGVTTTYTPYTYPHPLTLESYTTPPVISAVTASSITSSRATITWTTDDSSDSNVEYGLTASYGSQTTLDASLVISHSQNLSGLSPSTLYHYKVKSKNTSGLLTTSEDYTFTTVAQSASPNLALGITPMVDSTYSGYSVTPLTNGAIDAYGGTATTWASAESSTDPHWIVIDFGQNYAVNSAKVYWAWNSYQSQWMTPQQYKIQRWDGADYVDVAAVNNPTAGSLTETAFSPVATSRIRIYQPANMGPSFYSTVIWLTELEIYGASDTTPPAAPTGLVVN